MNDDGSSVLDRRAGGRLLLSWCALFLHGCKAALAWGLILYVLCGIWSSAAFGFENCKITYWPSQADALAYANSFPNPTEYCAGYSSLPPTHSTVTNFPYDPSGSIGTPDDCSSLYPLPASGFTGLFHIQRNTKSACDTYSSEFAYYAPGCPEGYDFNALTGQCEEGLGPCGLAGADDYSESFTTSVNPGLCEVGDVAQVSQQQLCGYSETANATCEYSYTGTATYVALGEFTIYESVSFSSTPCTTTTNPDPFEPAACAPAPPTCPADQYPREDGQGGWECVDPLDPGEPDPDLDQETPPANQTASRESTVTETTTTTNNPDGSVTTTTTRTETIGDCPPGEVCVQEIDYEGPGDRVGDTKTFGESLLAFYAAIEEAPLVNAANGISDAIPESSTCPTWTSDNIPILDDTVTVDGHCLAIEGHEETLRGLMLVVWSLTALFILLSA